MTDENKVKLLRAILGISQNELAAKLGVSKRTIANYEGNGVIPMNKQLMIEGMLSNARSVSITGDSNITNTGVTGGDIIIGADQELKILRKKVKELEEKNNELIKNLHEMSMINGKISIENMKLMRKLLNNNANDEK